MYSTASLLNIILFSNRYKSLSMSVKYSDNQEQKGGWGREEREGRAGEAGGGKEKGKEGRRRERKKKLTH